MNAMGYVDSAKDVLNRTTNLLRDGIGRVKQVTNARSDIEKYFFNDDGDMISVENGNGRTRYYSYTDRSELRHILFADGNTEQYKFDGNGNQTERKNGMQQTIGYTYDSVDNLTLVDYPTGTDTTIGYDNDGRQTVMYDATGGTGWDYDWADNVTKLTTPQGIMEYTYDQWNRQTKLKEGTIETNYGFTNEKLSTITKSSDGVATALTYDNYGRLHWKNDGATKTEYGYDTNDRVNSIVHSKTSNNQVLHQETYYYDLASNLNWKMVNSLLTSYTYDFIDQLKTEMSSSLSNTYNYDNNGNRINRISNAGTDIYTYDNGDKLTGITRSYGAGSTYTYDGCGRTATISGPGGTRMFTWDYEDRLTNLSGGGVPSTNYGYNGAGSRTSKSNTLGSRTYKRNGVGVTAPVLSDGVATMVPGISEKSGGQTNFIHTDRLGSMKGMSNSANVTETADYDAFGKVIARANPTATQKGFASGFGYQEDGESGYKLLGHRYYDADTGRFLSRDIARDGRNWYEYCRNSPLKYTDETGLNPGDKFKNEDEAAMDFAKIYGPKTHGDEYGAFIYKNPDGTFSYTEPKNSRDMKGADGNPLMQSVDIKQFNRPPPGAEIVGTIHTHPSEQGNKFKGSYRDYWERSDSWETRGSFSMSDIRVFHEHPEYGYVHFVVNPEMGTVDRYKPGEHKPGSNPDWRSLIPRVKDPWKSPRWRNPKYEW